MKRYCILIYLYACVLGTISAENTRDGVRDSMVLLPSVTEAQLSSDYKRTEADREIFLRSPEIDITKALYGKLPGLNVYQGSGTSGQNVAALSIHGRQPLVLVDGFQRDIEDLVTMDIQSCTVLKDAVATALYGVRGANGVVLITTKRGKSSKLDITANYQIGISAQYRKPDFVDSYTYASFFNKALTMDGLPEKYSSWDLAAFRDNTHPYHYPNVDWWKETNNTLAFNHRLNLTFNGGNQKVRYYTVVDYMYDKGYLKYNTQDDRYSSKPTDTRLNVRTNLDIQLSSTTNLFAGIAAKLKEDNRANAGSIYSTLYSTPSSAFPVKYHNGIYGGSTLYGDKNPVALLMDTGNTRVLNTILLSNVVLNQQLDFITKGLSASVAVSFDYNGSMNDITQKQYKYLEPNASFFEDGTMVASPIIYGKDSETLEHSHNFTNLYMRSTFQASANYLRNFGHSEISSSLIYEQYAYTAKGRNMSSKNQSVMLTANYNYAKRYSLGGAVNYSGSSYLAPGSHFNLFYGVNGAWNISNEAFFKGITGIDRFKLFASHGVSGWDGNLTHELYMQSYGDANAGSYFFTDNVSQQAGQSEGTLPVENLTVEKNRRTTVGIELGAFKERLNIYAEAFWERRSDILVASTSSVSGIIGVDVSQENAGIEEYRGLDFGASWTDRKGKISYELYANGAFLTSKLINNNQAYQQYDYLYQAGNPVGQRYGLEVVGFFHDQQEINNSPIQTFSVVKPGDIKYKDQNGDNRIDKQDVVKMYGSNIPKFYFGFGFNLSYKQIALSADFQGMTGVTVNLLNSPLYKPLVSNGNLSEQFLNNEIPWTPETAQEATMPRLTTVANENNYRANSLWYRDGSFIKLRNIKLSYSISKKKVRFADMRIFLQGTDLFSLDNLHTTDPEQLGATYPSSRKYWVGLNLNF